MKLGKIGEKKIKPAPFSFRRVSEQTDINKETEKQRQNERKRPRANRKLFCNIIITCFNKTTYFWYRFIIMGNFYQE